MTSARSKLTVRATAAFAVGVLLTFGLQATASGAPTVTKVTAFNGILQVTAGSDDDFLDVYVALNSDGRPTSVVVAELGRTFETAKPCVLVGTSSRVECPIPAVKQVVVETGDGNDSVTHRTDFPARLLTGAGNDTVNGSTANETVDLGPGNDSATVIGGIDDVVGGSGIDQVTYSRPGDVDVSLDDKPNDGIPNDLSNIHSDFENLVGGPGDDRLVGTDGPNRIAGGNGNDKILMLGGDDLAISDTGADSFFGGDGVDTVHYFARYTPLTVTIDGAANDGVPNENDNVQIDVENLIGGVGADKLVGSAAGNDIDGSGGNDTLIGEAGSDTLHGGLGNDTLLGGDGLDTAFGDEGTDECSAERKFDCP